MREEDVSVSDLMQEICMEESRRWWDAFTGYYDGILEESDGYLDEPTTLETPLSQERMLKIQFHPGDTLYYINGEKIDSTGSHWELQTIPYEEIRQILEQKQGCWLYLLLPPLTMIRQENTS